MTEQIIAIVVFAAVLAACFVRQLPIGMAMLAAAAVVGVYVAHLPLQDSLAGFPVGLVILLIGVTFFFGIAQANGTIDYLVDAALRRVGDRTAVLPLVFFALAAALASMGNVFNAIIVFPIAMRIAQTKSIHPMLMGLALGTGVSAGAFAPTSLYGLVSYGVADSAGIDFNRGVLFAIAIGLNLVLLTLAYRLFGRRDGSWTWTRAQDPRPEGSRSEPEDDLAIEGNPVGGERAFGSPSLETTRSLTRIQTLTLVAIILLAATMLIGSLLDLTPDMGVLGMILGCLLCLADPKLGKEGMARVDWSTTMLVAGIITYVGVLQKLGVIEMLGGQATKIGSPLVVAAVLCGIAGVVSAFASTTAMLAALVPLTIPLIQSGAVPGWAMISAIGLCASIVDISPFSTLGAAVLATTPDENEHPRMTRLMARWGFSMIVVGPVLTVGLLVLPPTLV